MGLDLHSKKLSIAIVVGTLTLCALFTAKGSTRLVATWLLPVQGQTVSLSVSGKGLPELPGSKTPDIRAMLKRNIFDPTTGALWPPKKPIVDLPEETDGSEGAQTTRNPWEMPPPCDGEAKVIAAFHSPRQPALSFAQVKTGSGAPMLYRTGGEIDGKAIDSIYPKAVFLRDGADLCSITIFESKAGGKSKGKKTPKIAPKVAKTTRKKPNGGVSKEEMDQHISKVSDTKYTIDRELLDKVLANQSQLMRSARVVPHEQDGQVVGVKLYGIRRKSLFGQLGLQNGDLLRTINGHSVGSPDSALEAYTKLRSAANLSLAITRRGKPTTNEYEIKE